MTRRRKISSPKTELRLAPGDLVLLGEAGTLMPRAWYRGEVQWSDGEQILVRQWGFGGQGSWLSVLPASHVRAVGDHAFLNEFRERCCGEIADLTEAVDAAEQATASARAAVWARLDAIGADVVQRSEASHEVDPA